MKLGTECDRYGPPTDADLLRGDPINFDREEALQERNAERRYQRALARHPDPRDPDYPGDFEGDDE